MSDLPPGPWSRMWSTYRIMSDPARAYREMQTAYGDLFTVPAMNGTVVVTCDPEQIRSLFSMRSTDVRPFAVEALKPLVGEGSVLVLHGKPHHRERRILMPPFHGPRMKAYGDTILQIARDRIHSWQPGQELVVQDEMLQITFRVIVYAVFGVTDPERVEEYISTITDLVATLRGEFLFFRALQRPILPQWARFVAAVKALDDLLYEDIAAARRREGGDDILSLLVAARYENEEGMSDASIRDELVTLLFAGHETTAIALALCVARMHAHPEAADWLTAERTKVGDAVSDLRDCVALTAFWKETLRLDTIVPDVLRTLEHDLAFGGYVVPQGTSVGVAIERVHRRPEIYPDPEQFRPQRFLERKFSPFEYLPFGGGVRRCVGMALATFEMEIVLSELAIGPRLRVTSQDVMKRRNVVMGPSEGVRAVVEPRSSHRSTHAR